MGRIGFRGVCVVAAVAALAWSVAAEAQERRGPQATQVSGDMGIRPFLGATGDLNIHGRGRFGPRVARSVFVLGADLYIGPGEGLAYALGMHMGMGDGTLYMQPLFEVHYRFPTPIPLVPWVGGGAGAKIGFGDQEVSLAVTFRFVTGVEFFITDMVGVGMQLAIPDLGPLLLPEVLPIGTIEWIVGPHFRF